MMKHTKDFAEMLDEQVGKIIEKGDISPTEAQNLYNAACALEKMAKFDSIMESVMDGEYSSRRMSMGRSMYGPYSAMPDYDMSYDGYSRDSGRSMDGRSSYNGYSGHSSREMVAFLERELREAQTEKERRAIREHLRALEEN